MTSHFMNTVFTPAVKAAQEANGSRHAYSRHDYTTEPDRLGERETAFITARDSFYLASTTETGWPYIQHRGGPIGFVKVLDERTLAFADFRGNRQYVSVGNTAANDRVALFLMDYPNRVRLKMLGRMHAVNHDSDPATMAAVTDPSYKARIERTLVIDVEAFDWNCPAHITPRYTLADIAPGIAQLRARISELEREIAHRDRQQ